MVESLGNAVIHVRIKGDNNIFDRIGISEINTSYHEKQLDIFSMRSTHYQGHVLGGDRMYKNVTVSEIDNIQAFGSIMQRKLPGSTHIWINGGYYNNFKLGDPNMPEFTPAGETSRKNGKEIPSIQVPTEYQEHYGKIQFEDGSKLTCGPKLSNFGTPLILKKDLQNKDFQFNPNKKIIPGHLKHLNHPNPRAAISTPGEISPKNRYRLLIAHESMERGEHGNGFTGSEWSNIGARADRMNETPGSSLNLDGGMTVTSGVSYFGKTLLEIKAKEKSLPAVTPIIIAFSERL